MIKKINYFRSVYLKYNVGILYSRLVNAKTKRPLLKGKSDEELKQFINEKLRSFTKGKPNYKNQKTNEFISVVIEYILSKNESIGYFALHKIFYLLEYNYFLKYNQRLTSSYIVRQKDGPYCTDLHIKKLTNSIPDLQTE